jgi:DNA-binding response OmpR family regulator
MSKPRILIVNDEPELVRLLVLMLSTRYEVRSTYDATQTLEAALEFKPNLVLLDWVMPQMDGGNVAQQIRAESRLRGTRILIHSAVLSKRDELGEMAGSQAVAKAARVKQLLEAIEKHMSQIT